MTIQMLHQLNEEQIAQIKELEDCCRIHDGLKGEVFLSNELNFNPQMASFYLLYDGEQLISFLSLFAPEPVEAEISAFTRPERRRTGCFTILFQAAVEELKRFHVPEVLFVQEPSSADAKAALRTFNTTLSHSEYLLDYTQGDLAVDHPDMKVALADKGDIDQIIAINTAVFGDSLQVSTSLVSKSMESEVIDYYVASIGNEIVGVFNVNFENEEVSIFGLGIAPQHQGKGYGKDMLKLLIKELKARGFGRITLEVNSQNDRAFHLYRKYGFEIRTQFDYYRYAI